MNALARVTALLLCGVCAAACSDTDDVNAAALTGPAALAQADTSAGATAQTLPTDLDGQIRRAQLLRAQGSLQEAGHSLSQLMLIAPDDPRVVGEYGKTLVQEGRSQDALAFLKRATELQPNDWTIYSAMGVAYDQTSDFANAKLAYEHALTLNPNSAAVLNNYAMSRVLAGDLPRAQQLMAQASAQGDADPKIAANVAMVAQLSGKGAVAPVAVASVSHSAVAASAPAALPQATPSAAGQVVMQRVPVDPKAGPVRSAAVATPRRAARTASAKKPAQVANNAPSLRSGTDGLRADASSP